MVRAEFTVDLPDGVWAGSISRAYPEATFRVLSALPGSESGFGLLEIRSEDLPAILDRMRDADALRSVETVYRSEDRVVLQFESTQFPLLVTVQQAQVPLEFPIELQDGHVTLSLTAPRDRISEFADQLHAVGVPHSLDRIYRAVDADDVLTDHQGELLRAALDRGYYDTPRDITLTELAEAVDAAPSTVSETLHRIEESVLKEYAAEQLDDA
jgi:hypothetical protein